MTRAAVLCVVVLCLSGDVKAQIRVDPNGVNVNAQGATTVLLTFGGLAGYTVAEAMWCGEVIPATPGIGLRCDPSTIFGALPARYTWGRASGVGAFTDIMSIPPSVARRAYQDAATGRSGEFYYVRRFVARDGRPDQYVRVTCRMTGGGARTPLSLVDVQLGFAVDTPVLQVAAGSRLPSLSAEIAYTGTGRLKGRWEVVLPGQDPPTPEDLLPEAALPIEERASQRRYAEVGRFNVFLPPVGRYALPGPDPSRLPTGAAGIHLVLLRIEASDDKEADSNLALVNAGTGVVHAGGVAGFPMPVLRYVVGAGGSEHAPTAASSRTVTLSAPPDGAVVSRGAAIVLRWAAASPAALYRVEVEASGAPAHLAFVSNTESYVLPPFVVDRAASGELRWRLTRLDGSGRAAAVSEWRQVKMQ